MDNLVTPEDYTYSVLELIGSYLEDRMVTQGNPTQVNGIEYENEVFYIRGHRAEVDDTTPPNFWYKKSNYQFEWYIHVDRGAYSNKPVTFDQAYEMLRECISSVDASTVVPPGEDYFWEDDG